MEKYADFNSVYWFYSYKSKITDAMWCSKKVDMEKYADFDNILSIFYIYI
jgi:hypothetical protein